MSTISIIQLFLSLELLCAFLLCFFSIIIYYKIKKIDEIKLKDYLYYTYWYINYPKTIFFTFIYLLVIYLIYFIKKISTYHYKKIVLGFTIILIQSLIIFIFLYFPYHTPFKLYKYSKPKKRDLKKEPFIGFLAIGDPQLEINKKRIEQNFKLINHINTFIRQIKNNDFSQINFNQETETEKNNIKKFINDTKNNLVGLINPGDMTQTGSLVGFSPIEPNTLGMYEYFYNNNTEDKGLLDLDSYEILGNHDYDTKTSQLKKIDINKIIDKYPSREIIRRRNKNRKYIVHKDNNGNYSCNFGNLHVIFINLHLSEEKIIESNTFLSDKPKTNKEFLKKDLEKYCKNMKFIIVTHFHTNNLSIKQNNSMMNILNPYKDNLLIILSGHHHLKEWFYVSKNNNMILPSPAYKNNEPYKHQYQSPYQYQYQYQFVYFIFNNLTKKLDKFSVSYDDNINKYIVNNL